MKHVVSFSGGAGSFCAAKWVCNTYGPENVVLVFCDTLIEDEDLYRFIDEAAAFLKCKLIKLADGRTPWEVFKDKKYVGNTRTAHCSQVLKRDQFQKWLRGQKDCVLYFGFDWTEHHRLESVRRVYSTYQVEAPMVDKLTLHRTQMLKVIRDCGLSMPRLYTMGFEHNNCGGFCVRAGQAHFYRLLKTMPERYAHHENEQEKIMAHNPKARPFLRVTEGGELGYVTLKDFRKGVEADKQIDMLDVGGCGCFV